MVETNPLFTVIIPTRNRALLLKKCIASVRDQVFSDWELIVVDDGSEDNTRDIVSEFQDKRISYVYQEHQERSTARNRGIEEAAGQYICFIDDDDYVTRHYLNDFYKYYKENNFNPVIVRTGFLRKRGDKYSCAPNYEKRKHGNPVKFVIYNMCGIGSLSIPRQALVGDQFPQEFPHWQDTHLYSRLLMEYDFFQLPSYNYIYLIHTEMGSQKAFKHYDPIKRADLNTAAITDLFNKEGSQLLNYVPKNSLNFLLAEKYLEYAINSLTLSGRESQILFRKSADHGIFPSLWKLYVRYYALRFKKILNF